MKRIKIPKRNLTSTTFNVNKFYDEQCLKNFRFSRKETSRIADFIGFMIGKTTRNQYSCNFLTASCIVTRQLASPCRWTDVERMFGMRNYLLLEVFWEVLEAFIEEQDPLLERSEAT